MLPRFSLRLDFERHRLGPGKASLLEGIRRTGSIAAAGRDMAMSYRRAWLLVDDLNHMFRGPLVQAQTGGRSGGGARLTDLGEEVLALYGATHATMTAAVEEQLRHFEALSAAPEIVPEP